MDDCVQAVIDDTLSLASEHWSFSTCSSLIKHLRSTFASWIRKDSLPLWLLLGASAPLRRSSCFNSDSLVPVRPVSSPGAQR